EKREGSGGEGGVGKSRGEGWRMERAMERGRKERMMKSSEWSRVILWHHRHLVRRKWIKVEEQKKPERKSGWERGCGGCAGTRPSEGGTEGCSVSRTLKRMKKWSERWSGLTVRLSVVQFRARMRSSSFPAL